MSALWKERKLCDRVKILQGDMQVSQISTATEKILKSAPFICGSQ